MPSFFIYSLDTNSSPLFNGVLKAILIRATTGPTTGAVFMTLDEARVDLEPVQTVKKGQHFSMKSDKIRPSDKLYKLVSTEELKKFKGLDIEQKRG